MACGLDDREGVTQAPPHPWLSRTMAALHRWLRRLAASDDMARLSDRDRRDIGMNKQDIATVVDREITRLHTKDLYSRK